MIGIRENTKFEMAFGEFRAISEGRCFEPISGRGVVVLGQYLTGAYKAGISWGKVGAEEEKVATFHGSSQTAQKRERIEIGKDAEESNEAGGA